MAITDYIPNVFGNVPEGYSGLLGPEVSKDIQGRANIQGLLGAAATLAQGMSSAGPRRSALQNILGSLAGGYQASTSAMDQSLKNYQNQMQLSQSIASQKAINSVLQDPKVANDPVLSAYFRTNPGEAFKYYMENMPIQQAISGGAVPSKPAMPAVDMYANNAAAPQVNEPATVQPAQDGQLAPVPVTAPPSPDAALMTRKNDLLAQNQRLGTVASKSALDRVKANNDEITAIDKQLDRSAVSGYNFQAVVDTVPAPFKDRVRGLQKAAETGAISMADLTQRLGDIEKEATAYVSKKTDYTNQDRRLAAGMFNGKEIEQLTPIELMKLQNEIDRRAEKLRAAGRSVTNVNVGDKVLAAERAKAQVVAEEGAINAQNAASDVRAIVDILKPYRGGALQDFAGSIGAYLPGTSLENLATSRQAAEAIRAKLAPTLRVANSGATSDFEIKSFLSAIPSLFNTAQGRELMATYSEKLANRAAAAADIRAKLTEEGPYSIKNFQKELKNQGLDRVFTNEDLNILRGKNQATPNGVRLTVPGAAAAYDKYRPQGD
jgi:hypothetical protein